MELSGIAIIEIVIGLRYGFGTGVGIGVELPLSEMELIPALNTIMFLHHI